MRVKCFELRDRATFVPVMGVEMLAENEDQGYLLNRAGYGVGGRRLIMFTRLGGQCAAHHDPFNWGDRTFHVAHSWIETNWDTLNDGDVIDVEYILGETTTKKTSEKLDPALW